MDGTLDNPQGPPRPELVLWRTDFGYRLQKEDGTWLTEFAHPVYTHAVAWKQGGKWMLSMFSDRDSAAEAADYLEGLGAGFVTIMEVPKDKSFTATRN